MNPEQHAQVLAYLAYLRAKLAEHGIIVDQPPVLGTGTLSADVVSDPPPDPPEKIQ